MMRIGSFIALIVVTLAFTSCNEKEDDRPESVFLLHRVGAAPIQGQVTFTSLDQRKVQVAITLQNTQDGQPFPAHLHFGTVREVGELAFRLNDVDGKTGESVTVLDNVKLSDGETFTYDMLQNMNGSVKIHMNDSFFKNFAVASGNIGKNENYVLDGIAVCTGH